MSAHSSITRVIARTRRTQSVAKQLDYIFKITCHKYPNLKSVAESYLTGPPDLQERLPKFPAPRVPLAWRWPPHAARPIQGYCRQLCLVDISREENTGDGGLTWQMVDQGASRLEAAISADPADGSTDWAHG